MYQVDLSFGSTVTSAIRPDRDAGPIPRSFSPESRSSLIAGASASWAPASAGSSSAAARDRTVYRDRVMLVPPLGSMSPLNISLPTDLERTPAGAPATCCVNAASPDDGDGLERRSLTGTARLRRANTYLLTQGWREGHRPRHLARGQYVVAALRAACRSETGAPSLRTIRSRGVRLRQAFSSPAGCAGGHAHGRFSRWGPSDRHRAAA